MIILNDFCFIPMMMISNIFENIYILIILNILNIYIMIILDIQKHIYMMIWNSF